MRTRHLPLAIAIVVWLTIPIALVPAAEDLADSISGANATSPPTDRPPLRLTRPDASRTSTTNTTGTSAASDVARPTRANAGWWTTAGGLSLLAFAIVVCARFLRRWLPRTPGLLPEQALETLGRFPIDPRNTIYLVRCGCRILVLSTSADGLRTLSEITDVGEVASLMRLCTDGSKVPFAGNSSSDQNLGTEYSVLGTQPSAAGSRPSAKSSAAQRLQERLRMSASRTTAPEATLGTSREVPHG
jgi:flagellar biogenesis protein FliO